MSGITNYINIADRINDHLILVYDPPVFTLLNRGDYRPNNLCPCLFSFCMQGGCLRIDTVWKLSGDPRV